MNKEDFLQKEVETALNNIDFIPRYKAIAEQYSKRDESFKFQNQEIIQIAEEMGVAIKYSKTKEFYYEETNSGFTFKIGFTIRFNSFDFGLSIINNDKMIKSSSPWGFLVQLMSDGTDKASKIMFCDLDEVKEILKAVFNIYADLKKAILTPTAV